MHQAFAHIQSAQLEATQFIVAYIWSNVQLPVSCSQQWASCSSSSMLCNDERHLGVFVSHYRGAVTFPCITLT